MLRPGASAMEDNMRLYCRFFSKEDKAIDLCRIKNRACRKAKNLKDIYAVIEGPADDWAVVDIDTAIDHGCGYQIVD